jgi:hypothetical protein
VIEVHDFTPGPPTESSIEVQRRDGSLGAVECAGAQPYAEMVRHFSAVLEGAPARFGPDESRRLARILEGLHVASVR